MAVSRMHLTLLYLFSFLSIACGSSFSPARPPSIPLAVRSPYLSTWLQVGKDGGSGGILAGTWPTFWTGAATGWTGLVRVDGTTYTWMGNPVGPARVTQTAFKYTSTRSIFTQRVAGIELTVTFFSPVTPKNLVVGSIVSSYLNVAVRAIDGKKHNVQLYTDISGEWVDGDRRSDIEWDYGVTKSNASPRKRDVEDAMTVVPKAQHSEDPLHHKRAGVHRHMHRARQARSGLTTSEPSRTSSTTEETSSTASATDPAYTATAYSSRAALTVNNLVAAGGIAYHHIARRQQLQFAESGDQTQFGQWYYMTKNTNKLTHQSGADTVVRARFINKGNLANSKDTQFRAIQDRFPVFGYAINLGSVGQAATSNTFTISLSQEQAVKFLGKTTGKLPSLWKGYFNDGLSALAWFYNQYGHNLGDAKALDTRIHSDSVGKGGQNYATITSLAVRQAFGALTLTNTPSNPMIFMKEISSNGNTNTVDVIFPFQPIALYLNPKVVRYLLEPLLVNQEAGHWPQKFSIHDIGARFPNATGHPDGNAEQMPLEECSNMLIMALAYAQRANDNAWLQKHYKIFKQWNSYLIDEALIPANQLSTDDFAGPIANSTNMALKGIVAISAMSKIAHRTGHATDSSRFASIAKSYISKWEKLSINRTGRKHTSLHYGFPSSWSLLYNLFADRLLKLNLVPQRIYDVQSSWYATKMNKYGIPLDNRHTYTKVDWEVFSAAVASKSVRKTILNKIARWINETPTNKAFTDWYDTNSGDFAGGFQNRPVIGGVFALLAL